MEMKGSDRMLPEIKFRSKLCYGIDEIDSFLNGFSFRCEYVKNYQIKIIHDNGHERFLVSVMYSK